jgi:hypothetical protein
MFVMGTDCVLLEVGNSFFLKLLFFVGINKLGLGSGGGGGHNILGKPKSESLNIFLDKVNFSFTVLSFSLVDY